MKADTIIELALILPVLLIWAISLRDVMRRRDLGRKQRVAFAAVLLFLPPLAVLYLLIRPPVSVRRGAVHSDDPRARLVDELELATQA